MSGRLFYKAITRTEKYRLRISVLLWGRNILCEFPRVLDDVWRENNSEGCTGDRPLRMFQTLTMSTLSSLPCTEKTQGIQSGGIVKMRKSNNILGPSSLDSLKHVGITIIHTLCAIQLNKIPAQDGYER